MTMTTTRRKVRRTRACPFCGDQLTTNALGRTSHIRACEQRRYNARLAPDPSRQGSAIPQGARDITGPVQITLNGNSYHVTLSAEGSPVVQVDKANSRGSKWRQTIKPHSANWNKAVKHAYAQGATT
jgi:hypothetical protein